MEENGTLETLQDDTIQSAESTNETAEKNVDDATSQAENAGTEQSDGAQNADNNDLADFLEVKFNKEHRSLNRDEAVKYAQMGLNYERFEPLIAKLDYLAAVSGVTRAEYLERQLQANEDAVRQDLIDRFGNDEETIEQMMEFTKQKNQKAYDDLIAKMQADEKSAEESEESRIAGEFAELCEEFPELRDKGFKGLPNEVKKAAFSGEKLFNAYLQHLHRESKNTNAAKAQMQNAANKSAGSMEGQGGNETVGDIFLKGLLGK